MAYRFHRSFHLSSTTTSFCNSLSFRPLSRRLLLLSSSSIPLHLRLGRYSGSSGGAEFLDPSEQALFQVLDAHDSLVSLCDVFKSITSNGISKEDLQNPRKALCGIYETLTISLPNLERQFDVDEDIAQELLETIACARDILPHGCFGTNDNLKNCFKFLELADAQMDELLEEIPPKTLESVQLLRGFHMNA